MIAQQQARAHLAVETQGGNQFERQKGQGAGTRQIEADDRLIAASLILANANSILLRNPQSGEE